ncbi:unnamed protein product [Dicrocoelium dendriticum]|nr:unnamed protein product [Dicrocoelium dendriticum]
MCYSLKDYLHVSYRFYFSACYLPAPYRCIITQPTSLSTRNLPRSQHIATAAPCGSHLRYPDGSRFFSNTRPPSETPLSPMQGAQGNAMPLPGYIGNQAFGYVTTTDGGAQNYASWDYADRVSNVSFIYPGPIRTHYALPTSPTYDPALFSSAGFLNSRFPHQHYSTVSPSYYFRMPRSGSAGAGFSCAADTPIGVTNRQPPPGDRISRGRSVGPDPNGLGQTQPPQPLPRPSYRCLAARCAAASNHAASGRMSSNLSPPLTQEHTSALPSVGRSMSNSLSANDLASYRTKTGLEMRSTKSSFDLAPDLPCEPNLALAHCSDFYTRIAALIELDNNLLLATPSGWSERRSSLGRTYYTCDQTKQASWHHPTFGLHVPLGWERVDSYHHGVYYQHLLIPHCQRYHPNLWLLGPLKDPSVERENFFSDLRYLQSSMRHNLEIDCPDLENYKNTISAEEEIAFTDFLKQFDVETMVEVTRALDQLFYKELHAIIVYFEQERMRIVSTMFAMQQAEHIIPSIGDS